ACLTPGFRSRRDRYGGRRHDSGPTVIPQRTYLQRRRFVVYPKQEHTARADGDFVALHDAACGHLVSVDQNEFGVRRSLDLESLRLPSNSPVHCLDPWSFQDQVTRRAGPEYRRMIASQLDKLDTSLTVVNFQSSHSRRTRFVIGPKTRLLV